MPHGLKKFAVGVGMVAVAMVIIAALVKRFAPESIKSWFVIA